MASYDKLKEINIKNCTCYYFNDINKFGDFDVDNILIDEKIYENTLLYNVSYKALMGATPLRIAFNQIDVFIRIYDRTGYLALFEGKKNMTSFTTGLDIL